ncbi:hypothetical protein GCM10025873_10040 [Demequina sediminis]|nr:hypothetical protein GCM10025873_10040 [Demequina sediminis]
MQALARAHHDGSALYAPDGPVDLGDTVTLRMRADAKAGVDRVWIRTVRDGEPVYLEAQADGERDGERWFAADLELHNPLTSYRFLLEAGGEVAWLNGTGVSHRDVPDAHDFSIHTEDSAPAWLRDSVVYQVFPDRFARDPEGGPTTTLPDWAIPTAWDAEPAALPPRTGKEVFGGTLGGIESRLDHLLGLGVTTLYLTPFFPGRSNHRYDASTFDHVDPLLGETPPSRRSRARRTRAGSASWATSPPITRARVTTGSPPPRMPPHPRRRTTCGTSPATTGWAGSATAACPSSTGAIRRCASA